jgi:hypothetical protein
MEDRFGYSTFALFVPTARPQLAAFTGEKAGCGTRVIFFA